jgi:hypothetical protein
MRFADFLTETTGGFFLLLLVDFFRFLAQIIYPSAQRFYFPTLQRVYFELIGRLEWSRSMLGLHRVNGRIPSLIWLQPHPSLLARIETQREERPKEEQLPLCQLQLAVKGGSQIRRQLTDVALF